MYYFVTREREHRVAKIAEKRRPLPSPPPCVKRWIANDPRRRAMDGEPREFPQNSREFGEEGGPREMHGAAHRALMTAASIIWSFWANGQITGERRDYCYYMRPRTQSKPDYTLVSQSLSGLLLPVRLSESRCWEGARSLFKRFYAHHPIIRLLSLQLFPLAREIWISRKWISIFQSETFFFFTDEFECFEFGIFPSRSEKLVEKLVEDLWGEDFGFFSIVEGFYKEEF